MIVILIFVLIYYYARSHAPGSFHIFAALRTHVNTSPLVFLWMCVWLWMLATPCHIPCVFSVWHEAVNTYWLILRAPCHQNRSPLIQQLQWLPTSEKQNYIYIMCVCVCVCYSTIAGCALLYLSELLHLYSLPTLSALHQRQASFSSNTSTTKLTVFTLSQTSIPTSGTISPKTSGTLLLYLPSKTNSLLQIFWLSNTVHHPCTMCVCMFHIVTLSVMFEPLLMCWNELQNLLTM